MHSKHPVIKKFFIGIIVALVILLFVFGLLPQNESQDYVSAPKPTNIPTHQNSKSESFSFNLSNQTTTIKTLPKLKNTTNQKEIENKLLNFLNISTSPEYVSFDNKTAKQWRQDEKSLHVYDKPFYFSYKNSGSKEVGASSNQESLKNLFLTTINKLGLISNNVEVIVKSIEYQIKSGGEPQPVNIPERANQVVVTGIYVYNNFPTILSPRTNYSITIKFDVYNKITSISGYAIHLEKSSGLYKIISQSEAQNNLSNNQGFLINSSASNSHYGLSDVSFDQAIIQKASLGYLYEEISKSLVPIYIFEGTASPTTNFNNNYILTYITPASSN